MQALSRGAVWDRRKVYSAAVVRSFIYGFGSILLGLYLEALGFGAGQVGVLLTAMLAGGALLTFAVSLWADRVGRRRSLVAMVCSRRWEAPFSRSGLCTRSC